MKVIKPGADHQVPRGVVGGSEISQLTAGAEGIYMAVFRVPPGARSRPHYHANCESTVYMLRGEIEIRWGDQLSESVRIVPQDLLYVPPRQTHTVQNLSETEDAEYVVARNSPTEDSVEVPWADEGEWTG